MYPYTRIIHFFRTSKIIVYVELLQVYTSPEHLGQCIEFG